MGYQFTLFVLPFVLSALCLSGLWVYLVTGDVVPDPQLRRALLLWSVPILVWAVAESMRISATAAPDERFWHNLRFTGPAFGSVGYFLFVATYTDRTELFRPRYLLALHIVPVVTTALVWTNHLSFHSLIRSNTEHTGDGPLVLSFEFGSWFYFHAAYSYLLILGGAFWLFTTFLRRHRQGLYRRQVTTLLVATGLVGVTNGLFVAGQTTLDWTPVAGGVTTVLFVGAVSQYQLLDISPIARDMVVENMESGLLVVDTDGTVVDADDRAQALLGPEQQLLGAQADDVFFTSLDEVATADSEGATTVQTDTDTYFDVTVSPITDSSAGTVGRVVLFREVTARMQQRTRLEAQKRKLEHKNERLDQFASVLSHDLRNPLSVAQLRLALLEDEIDSEHTVAIERALTRMETMVQDVLTMARTDAAVESDEREQIHLRAAAKTAWKTTDSETGELELVAPDDAVVDAHWSLLQTALENLFRNAVDHNDPPVTVRVGARAEGHVSAFFVEDDGTGIPADERGDIFEYGHTTSAGGTGFGLAIVREVVRAHGWTVTVTDGSDGGARFEIRTAPRPTDSLGPAPDREDD